VRRFFAIAHYRTAGGAHGSCSFNIIASDMDEALEKARRKADVRGRSKIVINVYA
jgi:hypothetical protein